MNLLADMGVAADDAGSRTWSRRRRRPTRPRRPRKVDPGAAQSVGTGAFEVSGTASDAGGGVVSGVEVSVDGGKTWHPADGTTKLALPIRGRGGTAAAVIMSRAVDDSGNLEKALSGEQENNRGQEVRGPQCQKIGINKRKRKLLLIS